MFNFSKTNSAVVAELKKQLTENELAAGEQKKRILALREENAALRAELNEYIEKSRAVGEALINANRVADNIIARAKHQSNEMLRDAAEKCAAEEQRLHHLHNQICLLRKSCKSILASISAEADKPMNLILVSGDD